MTSPKPKLSKVGQTYYNFQIIVQKAYIAIGKSISESFTSK